MLDYSLSKKSFNLNFILNYLKNNELKNCLPLSVAILGYGIEMAE